MTSPCPAPPVAARRHTQARGRARREALVQAALAMLDEGMECAALTLPQIAGRAGIPTSSAYHFYSEINDLYKDLVRLVARDMAAAFPAPAAPEGWKAVVAAFLAFGRAYFNDHAAARQLMLGPAIAPEVKKAGCWEDYRFGRALMAAVEREFRLPPLDDGAATFFKAIQIADFFYSLSVMETGRVTEAARQEGEAATLAYLALYLPHFLPRRTEEEAEDGPAPIAAPAIP